MAISMLKIRRPLGRLIFNMGIAIPGKTVFLIETAPSKLNEFWTSAIRIKQEYTTWAMLYDYIERQDYSSTCGYHLIHYHIYVYQYHVLLHEYEMPGIMHGSKFQL